MRAGVKTDDDGRTGKAWATSGPIRREGLERPLFCTHRIGRQSVNGSVPGGIFHHERRPRTPPTNAGIGGKGWDSLSIDGKRRRNFCLPTPSAGFAKNISAGASRIRFRLPHPGWFNQACKLLAPTRSAAIHPLLLGIRYATSCIGRVFAIGRGVLPDSKWATTSSTTSQSSP